MGVVLSPTVFFIFFYWDHITCEKVKTALFLCLFLRRGVVLLCFVCSFSSLLHINLLCASGGGQREWADYCQDLCDLDNSGAVKGILNHCNHSPAGQTKTGTYKSSNPRMSPGVHTFECNCLTVKMQSWQGRATKGESSWEVGGQGGARLSYHIQGRASNNRETVLCKEWREEGKQFACLGEITAQEKSVRITAEKPAAIRMSEPGMVCF